MDWLTSRIRQAWDQAKGLADSPNRFAGAVFQGARDRTLEALNVPRPESLFIKALTGGGQAQTEMTPIELSKIKGAYEAKQANKPPSKEELLKMWGSNNQFIAGPHSVSPSEREAQAERVANDTLAHYRNPVVSLYDSGRDVKLAYGNLSVIPQADGSVRVVDKFKVDPNLMGSDRFDSVGDLAEGGPGAAIAYNLAKRLGTFRDVDINVNVPKEQWEQIDPERPNNLGVPPDSIGALPKDLTFADPTTAVDEFFAAKEEEAAKEAGPLLDSFNQSYWRLRGKGGMSEAETLEMLDKSKIKGAYEAMKAPVGP